MQLTASCLQNLTMTTITEKAKRGKQVANELIPKIEKQLKEIAREGRFHGALDLDIFNTSNV